MHILKRFKKVARIPIIIKTNGFKHSSYIVYGCFVLPKLMSLAPIYSRIYTKFKKIQHNIDTEKEFRYWNSIKEELFKPSERGYWLKIEDLELDKETLKLVNEIQQKSNEVIIGEIDQDGFLLSHFGPIRNFPTISKENFLLRKKSNLNLLIIKGFVGVKKNYNGNKLFFLNELKALHKLALSGSNVPRIIDVDFENLSLTISYIFGSVLREELAKKGAVLRDRDVDNNQEFKVLSDEDKWVKRIQEGKRVLHEVIDSEFVENLFREFKKIHASGFVLNDIKYGNIIIEKRSGKPYLIDFEAAEDYSTFDSTYVRFRRDEDIEKINLHLGTNMLTYEIIRERIKTKNIPSLRDWYAPVYFGAGLRIGPIWDIDSGYGRWHYILKKHFPILEGKRILDLGANNAFNSIQMLREGAKEVIGIELEGKYIEQGNFVKAAFEWADNKLYNFRYIQTDMKEIPKMNLGRFDMVIALCSLYYLDDESISNLIQFISTIASLFVLQCNTDTNIEREYPHTYEKASVKYMVEAVKNNGFPHVEVIAPVKYHRPLIIARHGK